MGDWDLLRSAGPTLARFGGEGSVSMGWSWDDHGRAGCCSCGWSESWGGILAGKE